MTVIKTQQLGVDKGKGFLVDNEIFIIGSLAGKTENFLPKLKLFNESMRLFEIQILI